MDTGPERIQDADVAAAVRRQARRVQWTSLLATVVTTAVYLLLS
jgi:hypothetical protein